MLSFWPILLALRKKEL